VPLLHGCVVVATHDVDGDLDGLSWQQLDLLARKNRSLTKRDVRVLGRQIEREKRSPRSKSSKYHPADQSAVMPPSTTDSVPVT
jgi:hypothetical protein